MAKVVSTFPRLALSALHFTSLYTILATPRMSFWENFGIVVMYFYGKALKFFCEAHISDLLQQYTAWHRVALLQ